MIRIQRELGRNIAKYRKSAGYTQTQLADLLTDAAGVPISLSMVSNWERGLVSAPAAIIPCICAALHCTSWDLYPHSDKLTARDVQLIETITALGDEEKNDLYYLLHEWRGDRKALLKLSVIHAVQDETLRWVPDRMIVESYQDAIRSDDPRIDRRANTDVAYVRKAMRSLMRDE